MEKENKLLINTLIGVLGIIVFILVLSISVYFNTIQFDYEISKCNTLNSKTGSAYEFTNTIEIDAKYNERCYYLTHHPMAKLNEIYLYAILTSVLSCIFLAMVIMMGKLVIYDPYKPIISLL